MKKRFPHSEKSSERYYLQPCFWKELSMAMDVSRPCLRNHIRKLNNCLEARRQRKQVTIQDILEEAWPSFKKKHYHLLGRPGLIKQVEDSIMCGKLSFGFEVYVCERCGDTCLVPHTCKSRFCAKCGKKYREARTAKICSKLYRIPHRQFVFSVPFELRHYFRRDRKRLDIVFKAVEQTFLRLLKDKAKNKFKDEERVPGMILFMHTFGRDLKWHPHIHALVAERYMRKDGSLGRFSYFHFEWMRKTYMHILIDLLGKTMGPDEKNGYRKLRRRLTAKFTSGFYVYGPQNSGMASLSSLKSLTKYVVRYSSHPPISEARIRSFDREKMTVRWFYEPHEDDTREEEDRVGEVEVCEPAEEFIKKLIIHIPDPSFPMIRYYGFYANKRKMRPKVPKLCSRYEVEQMMENLKWDRMLWRDYGYSNLWCHCGGQLKRDPKESYVPDQWDMLEFRYEMGFV